MGKKMIFEDFTPVWLYNINIPAGANSSNTMSLMKLWISKNFR